jgi:hypothetical protein
MNKKGELTSSQIVALVITILGFVILLIFLLVTLDLKNQSLDEVCRLSVLSRATAPTTTQSFIPLKCTTKKICLTGSSGCEAYSGEENVADPVKVNPALEEESKTKIEQTISDAMYDCWSMMGEGKLDLFSGSTSWYNNLPVISEFQEKKASCVICSRVMVKDIPPEILQEVDVNKYLEETTFPDGSGDTYIEKLTDHEVSGFTREFESSLEPNEKNTNEIAVLFMQIKVDESWEEAGFDAGLTSAAFVFGGISATGLGTIGIIPNALISSIAGAIVGVSAGVNTAENQLIAAGRCGQFTSSSEAAKGCSVIATFDYNNVEAINNFCSIIESNP